MNLIMTLASSIGRRRLAGGRKKSQPHLRVGIVSQPMVKHHDPEHIQRLALVFMDRLIWRSKIYRDRQFHPCVCFGRSIKRSFASHFAFRKADLTTIIGRTV